MSVYGKQSVIYDHIHTARFGDSPKDIAPLEFVRPLSELCLRAAALHFRNRPTFAGVPERYKDRLAALIATDLPLHVSAPLIDSEIYWKRVIICGTVQCSNNFQMPSMILIIIYSVHRICSKHACPRIMAIVGSSCSLRRRLRRPSKISMGASQPCSPSSNCYRPHETTSTN